MDSCHPSVSCGRIFLLPFAHFGFEQSGAGLRWQGCFSWSGFGGRLDGLHSASINHSYRITIEFLIEGTTIIPVAVGPHDEVY
jgi:hypothetical protein